MHHFTNFPLSHFCGNFFLTIDSLDLMLNYLLCRNLVIKLQRVESGRSVVHLPLQRLYYVWDSRRGCVMNTVVLGSFVLSSDHVLVVWSWILLLDKSSVGGLVLRITVKIWNHFVKIIFNSLASSWLAKQFVELILDLSVFEAKLFVSELQGCRALNIQCFLTYCGGWSLWNTLLGCF